MNPRTLLILVVLGVIALGGGWYFGSATKPAQQANIDAGSLMFPGLAPKLKDVTKIEVQTQGKTTAIALKDGKWGIVDRGGYPVIDTKLRGMLTALTELRLLEARTSDPDQLKRLGVEDPDAKDAKSTLLRLFDARNQPLLSVIVGHRRVRTQAKVPEQVYVRRPGDSQAWLAEGALQVDGDPQLWLDRDVLNIDHKRIDSVVVTRAGHTLAFARDGEKLVLKEPAEHPALDEYRLDDVSRALEYLTFQDVQPDSAKVGEEVGHGVFTTDNGMKVGAMVFRGEKDILVRFGVVGDDKSKDEAAKLAARLNGWTYQLGAWKEKALVPTLEDLKAAEKAPPADAPPPAANAAAPAEAPPPAAEDKPAEAPKP